MLGLLRRPMVIPKWGTKDLTLNSEMLNKMQLIELSPPPDMRRACVFIEGSSPEDMAGKLASVFKKLT
jgi:hypothetical protein